MKQSVFFIIAGILPILFGLTMILNPAQMLDMVALETNASTSVVLQWMGCPLIAIGVMNLMARNDGGSKALRAIMAANILIHLLGMGIDFYDFVNHFIKSSGLMMGAVVHIPLIAGFAYYWRKLPKTAA